VATPSSDWGHLPARGRTATSLMPNSAADFGRIETPISDATRLRMVFEKDLWPAAVSDTERRRIGLAQDTLDHQRVNVHDANLQQVDRYSAC
jgi:hypothetical protein